jgi:hypothetical protein
MFKVAVVAVAVATSAVAEKERKNELVLQSEYLVGEHVVTRRPHEYLKVSSQHSSAYC